jgi:hypothetical protein
MWEEQLIAMLDEGRLDSDHVNDLLIAYEAETGDSSLRGCDIFSLLGLLGIFQPRSGPWSWSGSRSGLKSRSWSGSGYGSRSGSGSGSWSRSRAGSRSESRYESRSWSGSRSG